jgi:hypothetical protein
MWPGKSRLEIRGFWRNERYCALQNLSAWPSFKAVVDFVANFTTPWQFQPESSQARYRPGRLSRSPSLPYFLADKLFGNKHFRRLIDGARRLTPTIKVRVRKPISREAITKLSASIATLPLQSSEMTTDPKDSLTSQPPAGWHLLGSSVSANSPTGEKTSARLLSS